MTKIKYSQDIDVLNVELEKGKYEFSEEIADGIILDLSKDGGILAIEILNVMKRFTRPVARRIKNKYALAP